MAVELSKMDRLQFEYLERAGRPLWWGHLERGEALPDGDLKRWRDFGLVEAVGTKGYLLTAKGRAALHPARS